MHRIEIQNFGPIEHIELDLKDFMVFIGPQASGKSTIAKAVYFFRSLRDDFVEAVLETFSEDMPTVTNFQFKVLGKYIRFFGDGFDSANTRLEYRFSSEFEMSITTSREEETDSFGLHYDTKYLKFLFSEIQKEVKSVFPQIDLNQSLNLFQLSTIRQYLVKKSAEIFNDQSETVFVPAGRMLLSILSDQTTVLDSKGLEYTLQEFIGLVNNLKHSFSDKSNWNGKNKELASMLLEKILKGIS